MVFHVNELSWKKVNLLESLFSEYTPHFMRTVPTQVPKYGRHLPIH